MQHFGYRDWAAGIAQYEQWRRRRRWWGWVAVVVALTAALGALIWWLTSCHIS